MYMYRYTWVDVGMLDYKPDSKLFLVKRVNVPNHVLEANAKKKDEQLAQKAQIEPSGSRTTMVDKESNQHHDSASSGSEGQLEEKEQKSQSDGEGEGEGGSSGSDGEAKPASDGEQEASQPEMPQQAVSYEYTCTYMYHSQSSSLGILASSSIRAATEFN